MRITNFSFRFVDLVRLLSGVAIHFWLAGWVSMISRFPSISSTERRLKYVSLFSVCPGHFF